MLKTQICVIHPQCVKDYLTSARMHCQSIQYLDHFENELHSEAFPHYITGTQEIVSLPHLNIHMLPPGQLKIQDYREIHDRHRATESNPEKVWFKEMRVFPFPCKYYELSFVWIHQQPNLVKPCLCDIQGLTA